MKLTLRYFNYGVLLLAAAVLLYFFYLLFYPFPTLTVYTATVETKVLKAGDLFLYTVDYCKKTNAPAVVYRTFHKIDESHIETFPAVATITIPGCNKTQIPLQTYATMPPGKYFMLVDAVFSVNSLRNEHVIFKTDEFEVVNLGI